MTAKLLPSMIAAVALAIGPASAAHASQPKPIKATYMCDKGHTLKVVFQGSRAFVTAKNGKPITLTQSMTADGFLYTDGKHSLRGRGDNATWTKVGYKPLNCTAKG